MGGRYKTFDSTGVAPNGRLFAGDVNAIEDMKADSSDFAQTIDLGTLRIGEAGLSLTRFGSAEAQLAGDLRVTKILRGLEGIIPGAFTTAQRDALATDRAPYGLAILNINKNIWEWNAGSDAARSWVPFGSTSAIGTLAARPAASSMPAGSSYFATDQIVEYVTDGTQWIRKSTPAGATVAWFNSTAPTGWVKYDGSNLPSATGIYADLATHLGGVATPNTKGKVVVGQDTAQTEFDALKEIGGEKTHILSIAEMPAHNHGVNDPGHAHQTPQASNVGGTGGHLEQQFLNYASVTSTNTTGISIQNNGGGGAHNNLQPYTVGLYIAKL